VVVGTRDRVGVGSVGAWGIKRRLGWEAMLCSVSTGNIDFGDVLEDRWVAEVLLRCESYCNGCA